MLKCIWNYSMYPLPSTCVHPWVNVLLVGKGGAYFSFIPKEWTMKLICTRDRYSRVLWLTGICGVVLLSQHAHPASAVPKHSHFSHTQQKQHTSGSKCQSFIFTNHISRQKTLQLSFSDLSNTEQSTLVMSGRHFILHYIITFLDNVSTSVRRTTVGTSPHLLYAISLSHNVAKLLHWPEYVSTLHPITLSCRLA